MLEDLPNLPTPWGMTAHVVYCDIDDLEPATHSAPVINNIIRGEINFQGFLITDCLTMQALSGNYEQRTSKALAAGCDAVLHCNGNLEQMIEIAASADEITPESMKRLQKSKFSANLSFDKAEEAVLSELNRILLKYDAILEQEEHELQKIHRE
jgi:beta-N-acetylhexosaminidase